MDAQLVTTLSKTIEGITGVDAVNVWTRVPGRERIYCDLEKFNGGKAWNGGYGHRVIIHMTTGTVELDPRVQWAGAATRDWHGSNKTVAQIEAAVKAALNPEPEPVESQTTDTVESAHVAPKMEDAMSLTVEHPESHLYHCYPGQDNPQGTYLELDPAERTLVADWNREIGNAVPMDVGHGLLRRYALPSAYLTGEAIARLMDQVAPLALRVADGWSKEWDGHNMVGRLTDDAAKAEMEIIETLRGADEDMIQVQDAAEWFRDVSDEVRDRLTRDGRDATLAWMERMAWGDGVLIEDAAEFLDSLAED